ncbi:Type II secretion system (T2SS), protein F [uncultured archaeon]|nr:Type II secretion system (T2SS), protein F [uncultured archaeon]
MLEGFAAIVSRFPALARFSKGSEAAAARQLARAGIHSVDAQRYLSGALTLSLAASFAFFAAALALLPLLEAAGGALLAFALLLGCLVSLPRLLALRREKQAEAELPFLLRELAIYIDIGLPFEKGLLRISSRDYILSSDFAECCKSIRSGATVQSSLAHISAESRSLAVKRALLLLSSIYETGGNAEALKRMAEELSGAQVSAMRAQSGRLSLLAIVFIAVSALIPSFFTVFAAVSPAISGEAVAGWQLWLAFLLVFPLLDLAALALMFFLLPPSGRKDVDDGAIMEEYLRKKGAGLSRKSFVSLAAASSLAIAAVCLLFGNLLLFALCLCLAPAAYFLLSYLAHHEIDDAEARLPDALYSAAATHRIMSAERMLLFLSKGEFGRLSEAFGLALRRQKAGEGFADSMRAAARHCPSPLVERAFSLLIVSYETGANMYFALREAAQDVVSFFALVRERSALLSIQRYTVLASCAFLVPMILGTVVFLAPSLSRTTAFSSGADAALLSTLLPACQLYVFLNAAISSLLLSFAETRPARAALYFALAVPLSQAVFALASSGVFPGT